MAVPPLGAPSAIRGFRVPLRSAVELSAVGLHGTARFLYLRAAVKSRINLFSGKSPAAVV
jgi:hypothetical protein